MLEAVYDFLRITPPFTGWRLPPGEDVAFGIMACDDRAGDYSWDSAKAVHTIRANGKWCGSPAGLLRIVAHEMVHMHLQLSFPRDRAHHGRRFLRAAALVCRHHHLDPKAF